MFAVERCLYPRADGDTMDGWIINHPDAYPFWANKFLHKMSMGSPQTARQYAYKLCKYLNYLQDCWHIGYVVYFVQLRIAKVKRNLVCSLNSTYSLHLTFSIWSRSCDMVCVTADTST